MDQFPILVTKQQARKLLNLSLRTIDNLLKNGELPRRKVGPRTLIPYASLLAFVRRDHGTRRSKRARRSRFRQRGDHEQGGVHER